MRILLLHFTAIAAPLYGSSPFCNRLHCHGCTGSLVLRANQETNLVTLEFEIQESDNLRDWVGRPERVTTTLPLEEGKKFVRIALRR